MKVSLNCSTLLIGGALLASLLTPVTPAYASDDPCPSSGVKLDHRPANDGTGRVFGWILPSGPECLQSDVVSEPTSSNPISGQKASGGHISWNGNRSGTYTVVSSSGQTVCSGDIRSCDVSSNGTYTIKFGTHSKTVNVTGIQTQQPVVENSNPISGQKASGGHISWNGNRSGTYTVVSSSGQTVCSGDIRSCDVSSNGTYTIKFGTHSKTVNVTGIQTQQPVVENSNPISGQKASGGHISWNGNRSGTYTVVSSSGQTVCSGDIRSCDVSSNGTYTIKFGTHSKTVNVTGIQTQQPVVENSNPISGQKASGGHISWNGNRSGTYTVVSSSGQTVCSGDIRSCDVSSNGTYTIKFGTHSKTVNVTGIQTQQPVVENSNPISGQKASGGHISWNGNRSGTYTVVSSSGQTVCSGDIRSCDVSSNGTYTIKFGTHSKTVNVTGIQTQQPVVENSNPISGQKASGGHISWNGNRSGTYTVVSSSGQTVCSGDIRSCDVSSNGTYTIKFGTHSKTVNVTGIQTQQPVVENSNTGTSSGSGTHFLASHNKTYNVCSSSQAGTVNSDGLIWVGGNVPHGLCYKGGGSGSNTNTNTGTSSGSGTHFLASHNKTYNVCSSSQAGTVNSDGLIWVGGNVPHGLCYKGGGSGSNTNTNTGTSSGSGTHFLASHNKTYNVCSSSQAGTVNSDGLIWVGGNVPHGLCYKGGGSGSNTNTNTGTSSGSGTHFLASHNKTYNVCSSSQAGTVNSDGLIWVGGNVPHGLCYKGGGSGSNTNTNTGTSSGSEGNAPFGLVPVDNGHDPRSMDCLGVTASANGLPLVTFNCDLEAAGVYDPSALYFSYANCSADINHTVDQTWIPLLGEQVGMIYVDGVMVEIEPEKFTGWVSGAAEISDTLNGVACDVTLNAMPGGFILWIESGDIPVEGTAGSIPVVTERVEFWW